MLAAETIPPETTEEAHIEASRAPLIAHLVELRNRLLLCCALWLAATLACYFAAEAIYGFLVRPLAIASGGEGHRLIYTGLAEAFVTYLKVAAFGGFALIFPVIAAQAYRFLAPGLYAREKRVAIPFLIAAPGLFLAGASLCYFYVMPMAWKFFLSFETPSAGGLPVAMEARVSEYLALSMQLILAFGLAFQLPLALMLLARAGLVSAHALRQKRRYAIVLIFIAAAVATPPDVLSQFSLALPLLALYEVAILGCRWMEGKATPHTAGNACL